jgi:hypothetical protein
MTTTITVTVAGNEVQVLEGSGTDTILSSQGETRTFYAHSTSDVRILETGNPSVPQVNQIQPGGAIRELTEEDFAKIGQQQ